LKLKIEWRTSREIVFSRSPDFVSYHSVWKFCNGQKRQAFFGVKMNCLNCGAPLELGESRTVLTCQYCRTSRRLEVDSLEGDRIVSLDRPSGLDCPHCEAELVEAAVDGRKADYCPECRGILIEAPVFSEVAWDRRVKYRGPEMNPQPIGADELARVTDCPRCQKPMEVHPHYGPGRAVIDSCSACHLVWLDNAELTSIERTPGRRR
jgi:Zn-finger nucleic acid-binding protein